MASALPRIPVKAANLDPQALVDLIGALQAPDIDIHSLMIVRGGGVVAEFWWEPYRPELPHLLYSLTKSFCSTAAGFAVAEGLFTLDDLVVDHFPDHLPATVSENLKRLKVRHLLAMAVGHETEPTVGPRENDWQTVAKLFLAHPIPFEPGTHFVYNTASTNMVSILIQKCSGETLDKYIGPRLSQPLGIEGQYWTAPTNWVWGGSGLHATTESVAKLGLLYLNRGKWNGEQLLPEGWAELATSSHISNGDDPNSDWAQGYGFQFWRSRHGYRGDGAFGQFCLVLPEYDAVVAMTSGDSNMQAMLNAVWAKLLPGFSPVGAAEFDPSKLSSTVVSQLSNLSVTPRDKGVTGPTTLHLTNPGESFELELADSRVKVQLGWTVEVELGKWKEFNLDFGAGTIPAAGIARWDSPQLLILRFVNIHTPASQTIRIDLSDENATVEFFEKGEFVPTPTKNFVAKRAP